MNDNKLNKAYYLFVLAFVILNVLATYIVTTESLNKYIITFDISLRGLINSFIGNTVFFLFAFFIISVLIKKPINRMRAMIVLSVFLSIGLFGINVYNRYYGTSFTFKALSIFRNPAGGFGLTIIYEALREIITYYRFIIFIPLTILIIIYYRVKKEGMKDYILPNLTYKKGVMNFLFFIVLFFTNITLFTTSVDEHIVESAKATYATQNLGLYNYLVLDLMGFDYDVTNTNLEKVKKSLDDVNKNKSEYINIFDGKVYTKSPKISEIKNIKGSILNNLNEEDTVTGILEDYNLVLIHLESFNHFLLENPFVNKNLYNLKALLDESYVFNNFYTSVGLGTSFDAELAVLTGLFPNGTSTLSWDYKEDIEEKNFVFQTLPKLFKNKNYVTNSFHGNDEKFYNRELFHPNVLGFNKYYGKESIIKELGYENTNLGLKDLNEKYNHESGMWITDRAVFDFLNDKLDSLESNNQKSMSHILTMLPHTPFYYDPFYPDPYKTDLYSEDMIKSIDVVTLKYLNYMKYYNEIYRFLIERVNGYGDSYEYDETNMINRKKTAFVFYGDHGSAIKAEDINYLYDNKLKRLEIRRELLQTISFIYVPGDNIIKKSYDNNDVYINEGLLKGSQDLVRGQIDLHRTIIDLFNLPINSNDYLFGTHGMSSEPSYVIDNKSLDIVTDAFFGSIRNSREYIIDSNITLEEIKKLRNKIVSTKKYMDFAMNNNLYKKIKK